MTCVEKFTIPYACPNIRVVAVDYEVDYPSNFFNSSINKHDTARETIYHPGYEEQEIFLLRSSALSIGIFERIVGSHYGVHHDHSKDEDNDAQDKMSSNITVLQGIQLKTVEFV